MKRTFLYRLFLHSKTAFLLVLIFLLVYCVAYYKKMDGMFYPFNSMYTIDFTKKKTASTYGVILNGVPVKTTHHPYWKKDFLETSLAGYCNYIKHNRNVYMNDYIPYRFSNEKLRDVLKKGLIPDSMHTSDWPAWYCRFAGYTIPSNSSIELWQYNFLFEQDRVVLTDSTSIYKLIAP